MQNNHATGGGGGAGGRNGSGGDGGAGQGGAVRALLGTINITDSQLDDNHAEGPSQRATVVWHWNGRAFVRVP